MNHPTISHQPKAGPIKRIVTHATTIVPIPIQAPRVVIATNSEAWVLVMGTQGNIFVVSCPYSSPSEFLRRFASPHNLIIYLIFEFNLNFNRN